MHSLIPEKTKWELPEIKTEIKGWAFYYENMRAAISVKMYKSQTCKVSHNFFECKD